MSLQFSKPVSQVLLTGALFATILIIPFRAHAIYSVGHLFSGPASGDGASVYWNPAAMMLVRGTHVLLYGGLSSIRLNYQAESANMLTGEPYPKASVYVPKPSPIFGVVTDATLTDFRFGLGATLPLVEGATWADEFEGKPSQTRYFATRARLIEIVISPVVAYRIHRFITIGAGLDVIGIMLNNHLVTDFGAKINQLSCSATDAETCSLNAPVSRENPTYDAKTAMDGTGWGVGAQVGMLVTPFPWMRLGVGFHSGASDISIPVDMSVELPQSVKSYVQDNLPAVTLPALNAEGKVKITAPMRVSSALVIQPTKKMDLTVDMEWIDFSSTSVIQGEVTKSDELNLIGDQVLIRARRDVIKFGGSVAYQFLNSLRGATRFEYESNTRPNQFTTPSSLDFSKVSIHLGAMWQALPWLSFTVEYAHYWFPSREIKQSVYGPKSLPSTPEEEAFDKPSPVGNYTASNDRVGVSAAFHF